MATARQSNWGARIACGLIVAFASCVASAQTMQDPFLRSSYYGAAGASNAAAAPIATAMVGDLGGSPIASDYETGALDVTLTACECVDGYRQSGGAYCWRVMPDGVLYRSYLAGPREPRIGATFFNNSTPTQSGENLWDGTIGGRTALIRYGTDNPLRPEGIELGLEGAAMVRLNLDEDRDLDASDFRFGAPLTYGAGRYQFKTGYYHLSSHLGDELITRTGVNNRVNYVRDSILLGVSFNPTPAWRLYGETAYAVFTAGGAEPWEFQFGVEYAQPGVTGVCGTPFFATNAHLREEIDFGGDWTTQLGWLWRGDSGSTFRLGLHYVNGKSTQYQFFGTNEEQLGFGMWYDF